MKKETVKPILSFTSIKSRLPLIDHIFKAHVELAEACGMDVCFSCQYDSIEAMTDYQRALVKSGKVELLFVEKDHGSNTKWTLCRKMHPEATLVVVDDDWTYDVEGIRSLLETHERYPKAVICRAYRMIPWIGKEFPLYEVKPSYTYPKTVTAHVKVNRMKDNVSEREYVIAPGMAFPEHFLGVLYPPYFPNCDVETIPEECRRDDDVFTGAMVAAFGLDMVFAGRPRISGDRETPLPNALWEESRRGNGIRTFKALKSMKTEYTSHLDGEGLGEVYVMTCRKYPNRRMSIKGEMERLGIAYTEQYDDGTVRSDIGFKHKKLNRCHLAKYMALEKFMGTDGKRMTLIEDDIRFLKDLGEVSEAIRAIPGDFGACRISWSPSPYIRQEKEEKEPLLVAEVDAELSRPGKFWGKCPWASTDGCTIMSREVAEEFYKRLKAKIEALDGEEVTDNSDDMLCRVCEEMGKPMYVYKPLLCIQVTQSDVERGKSKTDKFVLTSGYHVPGIVRGLEEYATKSAVVGRQVARNYPRALNEGERIAGEIVSRGFVTMGGVRQRDDGDWW